MTAHLCECGCGRPTKIATQTDSRAGHVAGQPQRFAFGHNSRRINPLNTYRVAENSCWLWTGPLDSSGYGKFSLNRQLFSAHRWFYEQFVGEIPAGHQVDHLCETRHCVNPEHLEAVTQRENLRREWESRRRRARVA